MNQKELNEIRRRFRLDKNNFSRIFGCYVNSNREVISWIDASLGMMRQEEQEMYLGLLKKTLSGTLGRNLIDIEFSTAQVADSDEHRLLQTLRQTECKDANARETLCRKIIESLNMGETNCLILLAADAYDGVYIVKEALEKAGCTADMSNEEICDALVSAITSLKFTGLTGTDMSWNAEGQVSKAPTAYVVKDGQYVEG